MKSAAVLVAAAQCFAAADQSLRAGDGNEAIRSRLEECLPGAMPCYEQTLWVASFFASKRGGVALERARRGYPSEFEGLIEEVYASDKAEDAFRRDWFLDCIGTRP
ncbi:MAG: hypothetical protein ACREU1_15655 [Burkholderiales bacterium]